MERQFSLLLREESGAGVGGMKHGAGRFVLLNIFETMAGVLLVHSE